MDFMDWTPCRKVETFKVEDNITHIIGFDSTVRLNPIGSIIWKMANGKNSISNIVDFIESYCNDTERSVIQEDTLQILEQLNKKGLVVMNWDSLYKNKISLKRNIINISNILHKNDIDIVLVHAPSANPGSIVSHRLQGMPPLGLGYMATWLISKGFKAKILDFYIDDVTFIDLENIISVNNPKIIAISTTTETYNSGLRLASLCKKLNPNLLIVMGGCHVTFEYQHALSSGYVDIVARHEGEYVIENICNWFINKKGNLKDIRGICYVDNGNIVKTAREHFIEKLDCIPWPDRSLFDLEKYAIQGVISTSRGCVGNCIFCAATALSGGKYRVRSAKSILDEMKYLKQLGVIFIQIVDDTMTADVERLYEYLNLLIEADLDIQWGCESRVDIMTLELLTLMKKAGCRSLQFGVEAGNQEMLDCLKKNITMEKIREVFLWCKKLNIRTGTCLMIGQPYDTLETITDTINFAIELQSYGAKVVYSVTTPFPGTYLYSNSEKLGLEIIERDFDYYNTYTPIYNTKNFSTSDIQKFYYDAIIALGKNLKDKERMDELKLWNQHVQKKAEVLQ